jgi:myo-inositol 2-dehydrogenase/D-chiro-inositol 1-dehydrogenase
MGVRIAVIGAGVMGADHARILGRELPGAELAVVCDADPARAEAVAAGAGAVRAATDPLAVIADRTVDAVLIASPDATHVPLTLAALAEGKPVLCEKPLAPAAAECRKVIAAETARGRRLVQTGFMRRFDPAYGEMKAALDAGRIGPALIFHCFHRNVAAPDWFDGRMAITNSAPHEFDIARWLLGDEFAAISVFRPGMADGSRPGAPVQIVAETSAGRLVNIEINVNAAYGYDVRGELVGESGLLSLRDPARVEVNSALARSTGLAADWRPRFAEAYRLQDAAWLASIGTGQPAGASAWDGYAAARIAEAGVQALAGGGPVLIAMADRPALYSS